MRRVLRQRRSSTGQLLTRGVVDRWLTGTRNGLGLTVIAQTVAARLKHGIFVFRV
ncbi:hypothetical protein CfB38_7015 (plasmid) [Citrobacter freundii]|nr:hypothetical protein CfB38_7015 [Citrobacter freundii]